MDRAIIWVLRMAALLVPREKRPAWRQKWIAEAGAYAVLMREQRLWPSERRKRLTVYASDALTEAWTLARSPELLRHPAFPLVACGAALIAIAAVSGGFSTTRTLLQPPFADAGRRVIAYETSILFGGSFGIRTPLLEYWKTHTRSFEWMYGFGFEEGKRSLPLPVAAAYMMTVAPGDRPFGVMGLLKPDVTPEAAQAELIGLAEEHRNWRNLHPYPEPRVTMLLGRIRQPLISYSAIAGGTALLLLSIAVVGARRTRGRMPRYWSYLGAKAVALPLTLLMAVLELTPAAYVTSTGGSNPMADLLLMWLLVLASGASVWWSLADQQARCRSCLALLENPVRVGSLGAILFEHAGIETVCCEGHGALYSPDASSDYVQPGGWNSLDLK